MASHRLSHIVCGLMVAAILSSLPGLTQAQEPPSVTVSVRCNVLPEETTIINRLESPIVVISLTSLLDPVPGLEPFNFQLSVAPGASLTLYTRYPAASVPRPGDVPSPTILGGPIYDDVAVSEGAHVLTSVGSFTVPCSVGSVTRSAKGGATDAQVAPGAGPVSPPRTGDGGCRVAACD